MNKGLPVYRAIIAFTAWLALVLQFDSLLTNNIAAGVSLKATVITFFSYFTILTNLLVAICLTTVSVKPYSNAGKFFSSPPVIAAITVYITMVSLVYNLLLRHHWHPQGMAKIADELLHTIVPTLFVIYWLFFVPKGRLNYRQVLFWFIYPLLYIFYTALHAAWSGFYPYPFIDANQIGYQQALFRTAILIAGFAGLSLLLVTVDKLISKSAIK